MDGFKFVVNFVYPTRDLVSPMSALDPSATIAAAYDPSQVPVSDRMSNLVEAPQGATALLAGLRRQREGGPLNILVRP